jgi:hypothetical protein
MDFGEALDVDGTDASDRSVPICAAIIVLACIGALVALRVAFRGALSD